MEENKDQIIDVKSITKLYTSAYPKNNSDFLRSILDIFSKQTPDLLMKLKASFEAGDLTAVDKFAHAIRGSCLSIGVSKLAFLVGQVEEVSKNGMSPTKESIDQLDAIFSETKIILDKIYSTCAQAKNKDDFEKCVTIAQHSLRASEDTMVEPIDQDSSIQVLIIEDSKADLQLIEIVLQSFKKIKYVISVADTLDKGISLARKIKFDVVLMDMSLPDSHGINTYKSWHLQNISVPVIVLSGLADDAVAAQCVEFGAQDYIEKNSIDSGELSIIHKSIQYAVTRYKLKKLELRQINIDKDHVENISRIKADFFAKMSHEIRTPMNGVLGMTNLLMQTSLNEEQHDYVSTIQKSSEVLLHVINEILDISKIESENLTLSISEFNLRALTGEIIDLFSDAASKKNLILMDILDPKIPSYLNGDFIRLRQVFSNLVSNAIKFTQQGEVLIRGLLLSNSKKSVSLRFEISDSGVGMSELAQSKVFDKYYQVEDKKKCALQASGTGLGLSISKEIVEAMSGKIGVISTPQVGTTFWFEIELSLPDEERKYKPRADLSNKTAIFLSDDKLLSKRIQEQLGLRGVGNIELKLNEFSENKKMEGVDFVIVDERKPVSDLDIQVLNLSKSMRPPLSIIRLIAKNAKAQEDEPSKSLKVPFRQAHLYSVIADFYSESPHSASHLNTQTIASNAKHGKLLIVEDNEINQKVLQRTLEKLGHTCVVASSGLEALDLMKNETYVVVFMDCQMDQMDGFETTKRIRELSGEASLTPIIALTANAMTGYDKKCYSSGMNDYLTKPIEVDKLQKILDKFYT